jgi:hypothetical protein
LRHFPSFYFFCAISRTAISNAAARCIFQIQQLAL